MEITQTRFPYLPVNQYEIDLELVEEVNLQNCLTHNVVPLYRQKNILTVCMAHPWDSDNWKEVCQLISDKTDCLVLVVWDEVKKIKNVLKKVSKCLKKKNS